MSKRKLGEETPPASVSVTEEENSTPLLFSPGLTERQQIALAMKLSGESSHTDSYSTPRPTKINKTNKHGESPLQIAAIKGDLKQVKLLIKQGAEVNTKDHAGWSPLHEAACKGYLEVCRTLLKKGARVNVHGYCDETPLHDATFNNHAKVVELLLEQGANPLLKNKSGKMPHEIGENPQIKAMLLNAAKKFSDHSPKKAASIQQATKSNADTEKGEARQRELLSDRAKLGEQSEPGVRKQATPQSETPKQPTPQESKQKHSLSGGKQHPVTVKVVSKQPHTGVKQQPTTPKQLAAGAKQNIASGKQLHVATKQQDSYQSGVSELGGPRIPKVETPCDTKEEASNSLTPSSNKPSFKSPVRNKIVQDGAAIDPLSSSIETTNCTPSDVKNEEVAATDEKAVVSKEEEKEEELEVKESEFYKYSYLLPDAGNNTSITQNGPVTLYVARNKRPVKRAPMLECRSPPTTRSRAGGKPVDNTEAEELKALNEGRYLLKSAVVTPRKKWLHQHATKKRHMGDIYEFQRRGTPAEPPMPSWLAGSMLQTKKYLLQGSVCSKLEDATEPHQYIDHIPPIMQQELAQIRQDHAVLSCKHTSDKERLLLQHEQSMLRVRRQALMKHPTPSACSIMLQQQSCEYAKKLQTVSYDINKEQLLLSMGEKVISKFGELSEVMYKRHEQEADTLYSTQRFNWVNSIHHHGLYDMPILGNIDLWIERVAVTRLKPLVEYYEEHDPSDSDDSNR